MRKRCQLTNVDVDAPVPIYERPDGDDQTELCDPQYQRLRLQQEVQAG